MPRPRNLVPKPRKHSSGQARVTIDGKDFLLGPFGSSDQGYKRILAQWLAKEGPFAPDDDPVTITELADGYWLYAVKYYGFDKDPRRGDACNLKRILSILTSLYGDTKAADFGPLDLRAVQGEMIRFGWCRMVSDGVGWCRTLINHEIGPSGFPIDNLLSIRLCGDV